VSSPDLSGVAHPEDNRPMAEPLAPLNEDDMVELERLLDRLPKPLEPLDLTMLDGFLVGVLLQPQPVPLAQWFRHVLDEDGRPAPAGLNLNALSELVQRRHAELNRAIHGRQWFDPWVFELDGADDPLEAVMPWVAGFAMAMEFFPQLMRNESHQVLEPLAVLYRCFDPEDLEDADDLLEMIEEIEPPADLADAVEGLVTSTLLLADVTRPQSGTAGQPSKAGAARRPSAGRAGAGRAPAGPGARAPAPSGPGGARRPASQRGAGKPGGPKR
jgi:uncharacterized protein